MSDMTEEHLEADEEELEETRPESCSKCGHINPLPYVFCAECGASRVHLGRWRVSSILSMIMISFVASWYFHDFIEWSWPLYILYAYLLTQFLAALTKGHLKTHSRVWLWCASFFTTFTLYYIFVHPDGGAYVMMAADFIPEFAIDEPVLFGCIVGFIVTIFIIPAFLRWRRLYGWMNAVHIILITALSIGGIALLTFHALRYIVAHELMPEHQVALRRFVTQVMPTHQGYVTFATINLFRFFLFEVFIFSAVKGYAVARHMGGGINRQALERETGFIRSLFHIANLLRRIGHIFENMLRNLIGTMLVLSVDMMEIIRAFLREIFIPTVSLLICGVLLHQMVLSTDAYVLEAKLIDVAKICVDLLVLILFGLIFLRCKSRHGWLRMFSFYAQLVGWLLPNLLVFFLLMSFSLAAGSAALAGLDEVDVHLPFKFGFLTKVVAVLLALLVMVILIRKRSLLLSTPEEPEEIKEEKKPKPKRRLFGLMKRMVKEVEGDTETDEEKRGLFNKAKSALAQSGVGARMQGVFDSARSAGDRIISNRPKLIDQLLEVRKQRQSKMRQLDVLRESRGQIGDAVFDQIEGQRIDEIEDLTAREEELMEEVDALHGEHIVEKGAVEMEIEELKGQMKGFVLARDAGALSLADFRKETSPLKKDIETMELRVQALRKMSTHFELIYGKPEDQPKE